MRHWSLTRTLVMAFVCLGALPAAILGWRLIATTNAMSTTLADAQSRELGRSLHTVAFSLTDRLDRNLFERYGDAQACAVNTALLYHRAWYRVGNQEVHLIVSRDPTFRTGKGVTLEDGHFALRAKSFRAALAHLEAKGCHEGGDEPGRSMRVNRASVTGYPQIHVLDPDRNVIEINAEKVD